MKVIVHTAFNLERDDHTEAIYGRGEHDMSEADASHWYTQAHAEVVKEEPKPKKAK